jgi:hypothetical protein
MVIYSSHKNYMMLIFTLSVILLGVHRTFVMIPLMTTSRKRAHKTLSSEHTGTLDWQSQNVGGRRGGLCEGYDNWYS